MKKAAATLLLCLLAALFLPAPTLASVSVIGAGAGDAERIYVAGNPDFYPVESYRAEEGAYVGAGPAFLQLVADRTGLSFAYIRAGAMDRRITLARNNQVDVLFASSEETSVLAAGDEKIRLFSIWKEGELIDVYCVFTAVLDAEKRAAIRSVAESLTQEEILALLMSDAAPTASRGYDLKMIMIAGAALLLILVIVAVLTVALVRRKRRQIPLTDGVTEIGNRQYFVSTFHSAVQDVAWELYYVVHFAFDVDAVNISCGSEEADKILRFAAETITQRMKGNEFCARVGSGAFAAAIYCSNAEQAEARVDEILRALNAYSGKYKNGDKAPLFHAGVCMLDDDDKNPDKLLYNVNQAYHRAVAERKPMVFADRGVLQEQQIRAAIREQAGEAVKRQEFIPYVQLIVRAEDGVICGGELLSRWQSRPHGLLQPELYLPILQETGWIGEHDLLMLEEGCKLLQEWNRQRKPWFLLCNFSHITLSDAKIAEKIWSVSNRYFFPRERLVLEVSKAALEKNRGGVLHNVARLKEAGFRIGLEGFAGKEEENADLRDARADLVKLDQRLPAAELSKAVQQCVAQRAQTLCAGIEDEARQEAACAAGCAYAQGFYYARPLPLRELEGFAAQYAPKASRPPEPAAEQALNKEEETKIIPIMQERQEAIAVNQTMPEPSVFEAPKINQQPRELPLPHAVPVEESSVYAVQPEHAAPAPAEARAAIDWEPKSEKDKNMLQILYGPYRLDLPENIDIDAVTEILRSLQKVIE